MNQITLQKALTVLPVGPLRYLDQTGSTNDDAALWAQAGAPDLAIVVADEQTAGRGRLKRRWFTPPGSALAFSLILRPESLPQPATDLEADQVLPRLTALGALAVSQALRENFNLPAEIKWPNDVLLSQRKVAGVLVEAHWRGDQLGFVILGVGLNVTAQSVPNREKLIFPATSVETVAGHPVDRLSLLQAILQQILALKPHLAEAEFLQMWEDQLAFKGEWVRMLSGEDNESQSGRDGLLLGLDREGCLRLRDQTGEIFIVRNGEVRLRVAQ